MSPHSTVLHRFSTTRSSKVTFPTTFVGAVPPSSAAGREWNEKRLAPLSALF